ncbi:hypothetical protein BDC45DRAFT_509211 [Circinella umbellata]|nr:hypothetical protein BDC45DRAFT_509211 [Circinella umbellata]
MTEPIKYEKGSLLEVFVTVKVIRVIDQQEFSQYTIIWNNGTDKQEQKKEFIEPNTDGSLIILLGIQEILKACPQDQPVLITITHKRMFHAIKNGCFEVKGIAEHFDILKPHLTKIRDMILSRKADVFVRKPKKIVMYHVLDPACTDELSITDHLQAPANVGSSSSSTQQQLVDCSSVTPPSITPRSTPVMQQQHARVSSMAPPSISPRFTPVMQQQQTRISPVAPSSISPRFTPVMQQQQARITPVTPPSRVSAFTPVASGYTPFPSTSTSTESHNQLLRSPYEQMSSEHGVYTESTESQICTDSSTIIQEQQQDQGIRLVRQLKQFSKQHQKNEEDSKRILQSQEAVGSSSSLPIKTKFKYLETNTQQVQEGAFENSSSPSALAIAQLLIPSGDGNKHITITDKQKDTLLWAGHQEHKYKRILRTSSKPKEKPIPTKNIQQHRRDVLSLKSQKALLRYIEKREKFYQQNGNMRKEHLEMNRWFDSMEKDDRLKVRRTYNAYNNIPPEKTLNEGVRKVIGEERKVIEEEEHKVIEEEERKGTNERKRKAICLDDINQQKQEDQPSDGIFTGLLKKIGLGKE